MTTLAERHRLAREAHALKRRLEAKGNPKVNDRPNSPLIRAANLWQKTSQSGQRYLIGRLGGLRVLILENRERRDEGEPSHHLCLTEAPAANDRDRRQQAERQWNTATGSER